MEVSLLTDVEFIVLLLTAAATAFVDSFAGLLASVTIGLYLFCLIQQHLEKKLNIDIIIIVVFA